MSDSWLLTIKPSFLRECCALPAKEAAQVQKKLQLLVEDPAPDAKVKKQLRHMDGKLHRLRSGDFRIFYTYESPYVSVLALRRRDDATYDGAIAAETLGGGRVEGAGQEKGFEAHWERWLSPRPAERSATPLPRPVDREILAALHVDAAYHEALLGARTEDDLLDMESVPEKVRLEVVDALVGKPLPEVAREPDLVISDTSDLIRYRDGELLGFLLRLNPEQERLVRAALGASGPTLLKGGPGTGKSTVALYRIRELIRALRAEGVEKPRILFTTYTNALIRFSEQLLQSLLGPDAELVEVKTADKVAHHVVHLAGGTPRPCQEELPRLVERAIAEASFEGDALQKAAQASAVGRLDHGYLKDEIVGVIHGRRLPTLAAYLAAPRPGRKLPLNGIQREAIWRVHERLNGLLAERGEATWEQVRGQAAGALESGASTLSYDAVVVDEAQDLSPAALQLLVGLCARPGRLLLAADANQSIYGGAFRWADVHASLRFTGRASVLRANHRSTREIGEAAETYLAEGRLDDEPVQRQYVNSGPLPAVRTVEDGREEASLLARFFRSASRELRLGLQACAVLCPTNQAAQQVAARLREEGLEAAFMAPKELDIRAPGVKTLTLKSAKGLEFPIVAIAGFHGVAYPHLGKRLGSDERDEVLQTERRTIFVAMTRAMRALLVVAPRESPPGLLTGFHPGRWNVEGEA